jgi:hypothetical protein
MQQIFDESFILKLSKRQTNFELFNHVKNTLFSNLQDAKFFYNINPKNIFILNLDNFNELKDSDAVIAPMFFHKKNNIDNALKNIQSKLSERGILLGNIFGSFNLQILGSLLAGHDIKHFGKPLLRMLPAINIKTIGQLLQKHGFSKIVVSSEFVDFDFSNLKEALKFLQKSGETNCLVARDKTLLSGNVLKKYIENYQNPVRLSFEVCFFSCLNC